MCGIIGISLNLLLSVVKIVTGVFSHSVSITADGVNNLFDATSSAIQSVSAKVSAKEADAEHPYGHGRFEYISALLISFIIVLVGFELLKNSVHSLFRGREGHFGAFEIGMMTLAVLVKIWIIKYNRYIDRNYNSTVSRAVAQDALNDVYSGLLILLCLVVERLSGYRFEVVGGLILSGYIMLSGYKMARDMVGILLGTIPSDELRETMERIIRNHERIYSVHNWRMHDYGVERLYCSVNVSMKGTETLLEAHTLIDRVETEVRDATGVELTIHIDPC